MANEKPSQTSTVLRELEEAISDVLIVAPGGGWGVWKSDDHSKSVRAFKAAQEAAKILRSTESLPKFEPAARSELEGKYFNVTYRYFLRTEDEETAYRLASIELRGYQRGLDYGRSPSDLAVTLTATGESAKFVEPSTMSDAENVAHEKAFMSFVEPGGESTGGLKPEHFQAIAMKQARRIGELEAAILKYADTIDAIYNDGPDGRKLVSDKMGPLHSTVVVDLRARISASTEEVKP
jgi:hypothetical protein